jgi:hypothetical protein
VSGVQAKTQGYDVITPTNRFDMRETGNTNGPHAPVAPLIPKIRRDEASQMTFRQWPTVDQTLRSNVGLGRPLLLHQLNRA